jgi:SAM-dependent methyltransferase
MTDALPLQTFDVESAGRVLGYRDLVDPLTPPDGPTFFADVFRGDHDRVRELQRPYLPLLADHAPVLDAGCGRGELLDLLRERGMTYYGVDVNPEMVERCRERGHRDVVLADLNEHLETLRQGELGAIITCQVIEHLSSFDLERFLRSARRVLRSGGRLIAETVNPHAVPSARAFWVDPTHNHPIYPETLLTLCRVTGFSSAFVFHPGGRSDYEQDRYDMGVYAIVATA